MILSQEHLQTYDLQSNLHSFRYSIHNLIYLPKGVVTMNYFYRILVFTMILALFIGASVSAQNGERTGTTPPPTGSFALSAGLVADDLALAMGVPTERLISSSLGTSDPLGADVFNLPLGAFPTGADADYAVLSSGEAQSAFLPNNETDLSTPLGGLGGLNNSDGEDMVQYTMTIDTTNVLSWSFDYQYFTEEYPEWVDSQYNDSFLIEPDTSTFVLSPPNVIAPDAIALITVNSSFPGTPDPVYVANAAGTTYDGGTSVLSVGADVPLGTTSLTLIFTVMDLGDSVLDTTVFIDNFEMVINEPPDCSLATPSIDTLWPPNHKLHDITVLGVTDPDGDPITLTIDSIFQDELTDEPGSGNTAPDGFGVGTDTASLRAERSGKLNGRVYHIGFIALDGQGASCSGSVAVSVPHDKGKKGAAVDEGALVDSTQ
jgi:hypothetical protein